MFWTEEKDQLLRESFEKGIEDAEIGKILGKNSKAVSKRRSFLGLKRIEQPSWLKASHQTAIEASAQARKKRRERNCKCYTNEEVAVIKENVLTSRNFITASKKIAKKLWRNPQAVYQYIITHTQLFRDKDFRDNKEELLQMSKEQAFIDTKHKDRYSPIEIDISKETADAMAPIIRSLQKQGVSLKLKYKEVL